MLENKVITYCLENNTIEYNLLKFIEECTEVNEVAVKLLTKNPAHDKYPDRIELIKELVDVMFRGNIAILSIFKDLTIEEIEEIKDNYYGGKMAKYLTFIKNRTYKTNL